MGCGHILSSQVVEGLSLPKADYQHIEPVYKLKQDAGSRGAKGDTLVGPASLGCLVY